jgi:hypothetical protein
LKDLSRGIEINPKTDRASRLIVESIREEAHARERRLVEVLVNLILFTTTNDHAYYRHFLMLEELCDLLHSNNNLEEFHGARSENIDWSVRQQVERIQHEENRVDFTRTWYLASTVRPLAGVTPTNTALLNHHAKFSTMRFRLKSAIPLMSPSEKLSAGANYATAYGRPSEGIHFSGNAKPYRTREGSDKAIVAKIGLLIMSILHRVHELLGKPDVPAIHSMLSSVERSNATNAKDLLGKIADRGLECGDFVLAGGLLAEILEVKATNYGNKSYRVKFLAERPNPDLIEDWFPASYVQIFYPKALVATDMQNQVQRGHLSHEDLAKLMENPELFQNALRKSVTQVWPLIRRQMDGQPAPTAAEVAALLNRP